MSGDSTIPGFSGRLVTASDSDYDEARKVWNGAIDHWPALWRSARAPRTSRRH